MVSYDVSVHIEDMLFYARVMLEEAKESKEEKEVVDKKGKFDTKNISFSASRPFVFMVNNGDFIGAITHGNN